MWTTSWKWGLAAGLTACLLVLMLPVGTSGWVLVARGSAIVAVAVFLRAVTHMSGRARIVWYGLWLFQVLTVAGDIAYDALAYHYRIQAFPSIADVFYLAAYGFALAALVFLVSRRLPGRDREAWIDTAIMTLAAVTTVGAFVILPMLSASAGSGWNTAIATAYPVLDLVVLSTLIRLVVGGGHLNPALALLVASVGVTLAADLVFTNLVQEGAQGNAPGWVDATFLAGVILLSAAVTAPGAASITEPRAEGRASMTRNRTIGLAVGVLTPPALLACFSWNAGGRPVRLLAIASILVVLLGLWRILMLSAKVEAQSLLLAEQARTDSLTGLPNRRTWDFEVHRIAERARLADVPLTVAILDLDHFKAVNDTLGHQAGDRLLVACAQAWQSALGPGTLLARYGGEEFAVALPGFSAARAAQLLDAVRRATPPPMTVSIGVAEHGMDEAASDAFTRADQALYASKAAGRDRVTVQRLALADAS